MNKNIYMAHEKGAQSQNEKNIQCRNNIKWNENLIPKYITNFTSK